MSNKVYLIATGEVHNGQETYTRHDELPPLCEAEVLQKLAPEPSGRKCSHCGTDVMKVDGRWVSSTQPALPQYCYADPVMGSRTHLVDDIEPAQQLTKDLVVGGGDYAVYATEHGGEPFAVTVERAERFNQTQKKLADASTREVIRTDFLQAADSLRHALSNALQHTPKDIWPKWLAVREEYDKARRLAVEHGLVGSVPIEGTPEADSCIRLMLRERDWPSSSLNAARAGWRAARMYTPGQEVVDHQADVLKTEGE